MCTFAAIAHQGLVGLAVGCSVLALACGSTTSTPPGSGGAGAGGVTGTGGASTTMPVTSGTGGMMPGSGGTTTATSTPPASGGVTGSGGALTGGTTSTPPASGGTTTVVSSAGGQTGNGGQSGAGGATASGGVNASGGGPGSGGSSVSGGGVGGNADGAASGAGGTTTGVGGSTGAGGGTGSAPVPSAGCGKTPMADGRQNITVGSASREFILKLPDNYDNNHPYRLVFGFHGAKYSDDWVATGVAPSGGVDLSGPFFGIESESAGSTIFVAPQAAGTWGDSDLTFVDTMLAKFEDQLCIDKSRIFSVGFSMGAIMTIRIACARSDVFRAVAPMSGSLPNPCPTGQHIAYWASHATNDQTIAQSQGMAARDKFVERNHCGTETSAPDANGCITYQGCDQGYPVIWCSFTGTSAGQNGHEPAPFAGPAIWQFLEPL